MNGHAKIWKYIKITENDTCDMNASIDAGQIAWRGIGDNGRRSILFMDLRDGIVRNLTADKILGYFGPPCVSNGQITWRTYNEDSSNPQDAIVFWDGNDIQIVDEFDYGTIPYTGYPPSFGSIEPSLHNGQIAYAAWDGNDYEIFL